MMGVIMGAGEKALYEARFWPENPYREHLKVWPFKTNCARGEGLYNSFQKIPSGVTLRYVISGTWTLRMGGKQRCFGPDNVFCTMPSESVEFKQTAPGVEWEWCELQLNGSGAESFLAEFGLGLESPVIRPAEPEKALGIFKRFHSMIEAEDRSAASMVSCLFELVAAFGVRRSDSAPDTATREGLVRMAKLVLESENSIDGGVEKLSARLGVERTTLYRAFKAETGFSPHEYIDRLRLLRSEELLHATSLPVATVAAQVGFPDVKYFIGWFKARRGAPPASWRRAQRSVSVQAAGLPED